MQLRCPEISFWLIQVQKTITNSNFLHIMDNKILYFDNSFAQFGHSDVVRGSGLRLSGLFDNCFGLEKGRLGF